jgi:hypothetical protein
LIYVFIFTRLLPAFVSAMIIMISVFISIVGYSVRFYSGYVQFWEGQIYKYRRTFGRYCKTCQVSNGTSLTETETGTGVILSHILSNRNRCDTISNFVKPEPVWYNLKFCKTGTSVIQSHILLNGNRCDTYTVFNHVENKCESFQCCEIEKELH